MKIEKRLCINKAESIKEMYQGNRQIPIDLIAKIYDLNPDECPKIKTLDVLRDLESGSFKFKSKRKTSKRKSRKVSKRKTSKRKSSKRKSKNK